MRIRQLWQIHQYCSGIAMSKSTVAWEKIIALYCCIRMLCNAGRTECVSEAPNSRINKSKCYRKLQLDPSLVYNVTLNYYNTITNGKSEITILFFFIKISFDKMFFNDLVRKLATH